jgi:replicative DNA helicase
VGLNKFKGLTDEAFRQLVNDVTREYERREMSDDDDDVFYDHISIDKELAMEIANEPHKIRGFATGYPTLDKFLCGLSRGEMTAIGADTSVGKSLFTVNLLNQAYKTKSDFVTLYFSLDTATINVKSRFYMMSEYPDNYPIYFYRNTLGITFEKVRKTMINCKKDHGLDIVVVDMLGSICRSKDNQTGETSSAVLKFRELALELDVHIIIMTHVSKDGSADKKLVPHYSRIKDSSSVYQDSDVVIMLGRDHLNMDENVRSTMTVSIQKNRNKGRTGEMHMHIDWKTLNMSEIRY